MNSNKKISFLSLFRVLVIGIFLAVFHLFAPHTYAVQPTPGSWTFAGLGNINIHSIAVDPNKPNTLYAGTAGFGIFKSTDAGTNWTAINNGITDPSRGYFTDIVIDPSNSNNVYAGGTGDFGTTNSTGIFKSTDAGATWTLATTGIVDIGRGAPPEDVQSLIIDANNPSNLYAAIGSNCGSVYKTIDGAATWTRGIGLPCDPSVVRLDPSNSTILYTRTPAGVYKSIDSGLTWSNITSSMASFFGLTIDPFNPTNMYANLDTGVYKSTDSGVNWTFSNGSPANIYKALITDPVRHNTVYGGINTNTTIEAYLTTDAGATWTAINNNLPAVGIARFLVPTNNPSVLYAGTQSGVYVYGIPPLVGQITATPNPAQVNQAVTASANFTDIPANTHTASWNWGDTTVCGGNPDPCHGTVTESNGSGSVSDSHTYTAAGVYTITLTVTDNHGATGQSTYQYVVVYDPSAGWVSGDKEFTSPAGAVTGDTSATGKANFGFQVKYQNGSMVPSGKNVSLSFPAGNINFTSTGYQWLVVNGSKATFKADGTLNGTSGYTILVSAIDQGSSQPSGLVRFQIKDSGGNVVYDTQQGAIDTADPTTSVTKGKITVH